jgi:hypothetical protein
MRNLKYLLAAVAIGSFMFLPQPSSSSPLVAGLTEADSPIFGINSAQVEKVGHRYYDRKRYYRHRYPHRRYYRKRYRYYDDDDYYYPSYGYYPYYYPYRRPYYAYPYVGGPFIGVPFISFGFGGGRWDD